MSIRIMSLVWELDLPDSEKLVLLALADCANDEGYCWPGMATLSRKCSKSERTIQYALRNLETGKHLSRREIRGRGCEYMIHPRKDCTPAKSAPPQRLRQTPATVAPKPSMNLSVSNETGASADPVKELFDLGVGILMANGSTEREARSLIGKHRKAKSDAEVLTALIECRTKAISNPVEWLEKRLRSARYVSASGYEYRGDLDAVQREAKRRNDMDTYWQVEIDRKSMARAA